MQIFLSLQDLQAIISANIIKFRVKFGFLNRIGINFKIWVRIRLKLWAEKKRFSSMKLFTAIKCCCIFMQLFGTYVMFLRLVTLKFHWCLRPGIRVESAIGSNQGLILEVFCYPVKCFSHVSGPCKPVRYELVELGQHAVPGLSGRKILLPGGILG